MAFLLRVCYHEITIALADIDGCISLISNDAINVFESSENTLFNKKLHDLVSTNEKVLIDRLREKARTMSDQESCLLRTRSNNFIWLDLLSFSRLPSYSREAYRIACKRKMENPNYFCLKVNVLNAILGLEEFDPIFLKETIENPNELEFLFYRTDGKRDFSEFDFSDVYEYAAERQIDVKSTFRMIDEFSEFIREVLRAQKEISLHQP